MVRAIFIGGLAVSMCLPARAADFDLRDAGVEALDGGTAFPLTVDGITATISTDNGVLNREAGGFGVAMTDDNGDFVIDGADVVFITFDQDVVWDGFTVSGQSEFECGAINVDGMNAIIFCDSGAMTAGAGTTILTGNLVFIFTSDTGGFSLDSFSVTAAAGDSDSDGDGVLDGDDLDPNDPSVCADDDGDGCDDCSVLEMQNPAQDGPDLDGDGLCDSGDDDIDGDSVLNGDDPDPMNNFVCGDSDADGCDDCRFTGGPPDVNNDGTDSNNNGICDVAEGLPEIIIFDLLDPAVGELDDEIEICLKSGPLEANIRSPLNYLYQDSGTFGVGDGFLDSPDDALIDGEEQIEIRFNYDVRWQWMEVSQLEAGQCASLMVDEAPFMPCGSGQKTEGADARVTRVAPPFPSVAIGAVGDAKFSLDSFAAVPLIAESIVDLQLDAEFPERVFPSEDPITVGEELILRFRLANIGPSDADDVQVQVSIPSDLAVLEATPPAGTTYDAATGIWSVPHLDTEFRPCSDRLSMLAIRVRIESGSSASIVYSAEVMAALQADEDSAYGNGLVDEDDDTEDTIDVTRREDVSEPANPLLAALIFIFTGCGEGLMFGASGAGLGLVGMRLGRRRSVSSRSH